MPHGLTTLPYGLAGKVYRSPLPNSPLFDPEQVLLRAYLDAGVTTVVMLIPDEEAQALTGQDLRLCYSEHGLCVIYAPVEDFSVPAPGVFLEAVQKTLQAARGGETVVIHCHAGLGRTGTFAACLAKAAFDMTGEDAVLWVRRYIPNAVENVGQYQFVKNFKYLGE